MNQWDAKVLAADRRLYYTLKNCVKGKITEKSRQEWVKVLRNKDILKPVHVDSKDNVADLFTKILSRGVFERLRDLIMVPLDRTCDPRDTSLDRDSDDEISLDSEWDDY